MYVQLFIFVKKMGGLNTNVWNLTSISAYSEEEPRQHPPSRSSRYHRAAVNCLHSLRLTARRVHAGVVDIYIHVYVNSWVNADFNNVISRTCVRHCDGASARVVRQACVMPQVQNFGAKVSLNFVEVKGRS